MSYLNKWEETKIFRKDKILEFDFLNDNNLIIEIEDEYYCLSQPFNTVEKKYYDHLNEKLANELNLTNVNKEIENFIKKLNRYNEAKDVAESLMGKIADFRNCTIKEVHIDFGLEKNED